jgi:DNA-3-methyladenine glycosylase
MIVDEAFFALGPVELARALIGASLLVEGVGGVITETEAYRRDDPASHSFSGPTARNGVMFGPPGRAYVYRSYGIHWCLNIVSGEAGGAVLIRALEPRWGIETMMARRNMADVSRLCAGPGRLCQALGVDMTHNGLPMFAAPFEMRREGEAGIEASRRIGITKAVEQPWRFTLQSSRFTSRPLPRRRPPA